MLNRKKKLYIIILALCLLAVSLSVFFVVRNVVGFDVQGITEGSCAPYNVFVMKGETDYSVKISWSTKEDCVGFILYGKDRGNLDMVAVDVVNPSSSKQHIVTVEGLLTTEPYYFLINSQEQAYGNNGVPLEFTIANL
jgi:hypothetical protein